MHYETEIPSRNGISWELVRVDQTTGSGPNGNCVRIGQLQQFNAGPANERADKKARGNENKLISKIIRLRETNCWEDFGRKNADKNHLNPAANLFYLCRWNLLVRSGHDPRKGDKFMVRRLRIRGDGKSRLWFPLPREAPAQSAKWQALPLVILQRQNVFDSSAASHEFILNKYFAARQFLARRQSIKRYNDAKHAKK